MTKYIVKNCPAGQIVTSAVDSNLAGVYCKMTHAPCQDCTDCLIKQIILKCKEDWEDPTVDKFQEEVLALIEI